MKIVTIRSAGGPQGHEGLIGALILGDRSWVAGGDRRGDGVVEGGSKRVRSSVANVPCRLEASGAGTRIAGGVPCVRLTRGGARVRPLFPYNAADNNP